MKNMEGGKRVMKQMEAIAIKMDSKPRVTLSSEILPEIEKWKVGKTYEVTLKLKQVGLRKSDDEMVADFEVEGADSN